MFEIKGQTLSSVQYYEEIPFYGLPCQPSDKCSITKFYQWTLVDKPKVSNIVVMLHREGLTVYIDESAISADTSVLCMYM